MVRSAQTAIESVDPEMVDSSTMLGYTRAETALYVVLPLAWQGILAGIMLAFTRAIGEFGATLMIAGNIPGLTQTLPIAIYDAVQSGDDYTANVLVGIITLFSFSVLYFAGRFSRLRL